MHKRKIPLIFLVLLLSIILTGCTGAIPERSWPASLVVDDTIYTASQTFVFAVDADSGKEDADKGDTEKLRYPKDAESGTTFGNAPLLLDDQLYISDYGSQIRTISKDLRSVGKIVKDASGRFLSSPVFFNDLILASNSDGKLYAYNKDLSLRWTFSDGNGFWTQPVTYEDMIFVSSIDKSVYALKENAAGDGADVVWKKELGSSVFFSQAIDEKGNLYIGTLNNELFSFDSTTGSVNWQVQTAGTVWSPVIIKDNRIFAGDQSGKIFALDTTDGHLVWEYDALSPVIGSVAVRENSLYAGIGNGDALCLSIEDKPESRLLWSKNVGGKLYSTPVFTDKYVVFGVTDGDKTLAAFAFSGDTGWTFKPSK